MNARVHVNSHMPKCPDKLPNTLLTNSCHPAFAVIAAYASECRCHILQNCSYSYAIRRLASCGSSKTWTAAISWQQIKLGMRFSLNSWCSHLDIVVILSIFTKLHARDPPWQLRMQKHLKSCDFGIWLSSNTFEPVVLIGHAVTAPYYFIILCVRVSFISM